jgi:hypothetical protein
MTEDLKEFATLLEGQPVNKAKLGQVNNKHWYWSRGDAKVILQGHKNLHA